MIRRIRGTWHRVHKHMGRRGEFLLIIGPGEACWGAGFIMEPLSPSTQGFELLTGIMSLPCWGWLWVVCGIATTIAAFVPRGDWYGYGAAVLPPGVWATSNLTEATGGFGRGVFVAAWYLTWVGIVMWAAKVPDHGISWRSGKGGPQ